MAGPRDWLGPSPPNAGRLNLRNHSPVNLALGNDEARLVINRDNRLVLPAFEQHDFGVIGHAQCFGLSFEFGPSHFTCPLGCNLSRVVAGSPIAASVRRARVPLASGLVRAGNRYRPRLTDVP
jgi:hypothetical protein